MPQPQHGRSLDLYHFQQLWGHLLEWQGRWGLGRAPPSGGKGTFTNMGIGALWVSRAPGEKGNLTTPRQPGGIWVGYPCPIHPFVVPLLFYHWEAIIPRPAPALDPCEEMVPGLPTLQVVSHCSLSPH